MPYKIEKADHGSKVVNKETGAVHAKHTTAARAQAQVNLLRGVEHGWEPTGKAAVKTTSEAAGLHKEKAIAKKHSKTHAKAHSKGGRK